MIQAVEHLDVMSNRSTAIRRWRRSPTAALMSVKKDRINTRATVQSVQPDHCRDDALSALVASFTTTGAASQWVP